MRKRGVTHIAIALVLVTIIFFITFLSSIYLGNQDEEKFYFSPSNQPPAIGEVESQIFVCENQALSYIFEFSDPERDIIELDIFPKQNDPFFIRKISVQNSTKAEIYSGNLSKELTGKDYLETITISDSQLSDFINTKISVIEINNPPILEDISVQTISLNSSTSFNKLILASDTESESLLFNINFLSGEQIFEIGNLGEINYIADSSKIGTYDIKVCVTDLGLNKIPNNIALCGQDGSSETVCDDFQLTITEENKPPTILSFFPTNLNIEVVGSTLLVFTLENFDPDGTIPETSWYIDDSLIKQKSGENSNTFNYTFGCGTSQLHVLEAKITDGLLEDTISWDINVKKTICPEGIPEGTNLAEGLCEEKWACYDWDVCQDAAQSLDIGILQQSDYYEIKKKCSDNGWENGFCGLQIRTCLNLNECNLALERPQEIQECYFALSPTCSDNIKNCHDNSCEVLIDCGGPCNTCASCTDGIKNQDEERVDCGGQCSETCQTGESILEKESVRYIIIALLVISAFFLIIHILKIIEMKKELKAPSPHGKKPKKENDNPQSNKQSMKEMLKEKLTP